MNQFCNSGEVFELWFNIYTCIHIYIYTYIYISTYVYLYIYVILFILYYYIYIYIYIYITYTCNICTHTYTQSIHYTSILYLAHVYMHICYVAILWTHMYIKRKFRSSHLCQSLMSFTPIHTTRKNISCQLLRFTCVVFNTQNYVYWYHIYDFALCSC
jgi:hypothetical protein